MPAERREPEKTLEERLAEAPGEVLMQALTVKLVDDPTAGDPRFSSYRRPPAVRVGEKLTDAFPDAKPELLMTTIAERVPTMSLSDFTYVASGITGIGHFFPDMVAPTYVRGITEISMAIGTRKAVDKMSAQLQELRTPPRRG